MTPARPAGREILAYADGSCLGNPGPGGWGVVIIEGDGTGEYSGGNPHTTNNRMEIAAVIEALRRLPAGARVLVRSDSQYVVNTINSGWKRNANTDLWKELDAEIARRKVKFEWVRGHAGEALNDRADRLALEAAKAAADARRSPARGISAPAARGPAHAAQPSAIDVGAPAVAQPDEPALETVRPFLNEGESVRQCAHCGGKFIAPDRYKDSYCALVACQLERRSKRA
jgi:ribonuclease HI